MSNWRIKLSLFLNYFVFAILLNSVGTVILQVQCNFSISESSASVLEAFKDLSIAIVSFLVASYIVRIGYKNSMLIALGFISLVCLLMPSLNFKLENQKKDASPLPWHPGAVKYFAEKGVKLN